MNEEKNILHLKDYIYIVVGVALFLVVLLRYLNTNLLICIWGDEFGYWNGAAYLLNLDWSEVSSANQYYGWGYGIILAPIMKIFGYNVILMRKCAVVCQAVMLSSCIYVCYYICRIYYKIDRPIVNICISLISVGYISNLVYVNFILAEVILTTVLWWAFFCIVKYIKTKKILYLLLFNMLCLYTYSIHSRAIGVVVVAVICDICVFFREKSKKSIAIAVISIGLIIVAFFSLKMIRSSYISTMYSKIEYTAIESNLETGKMSKLLIQFSSLEGYISLIQNIVGNIFYIIVGSFGIIFFFAVCAWKKLKGFFLNREEYSLEIAVALFFCVAVAICILFWSGSDTRNNIRADSLFYGRYYEYIIGPCLMVGLAYIYNCERSVLKKIYSVGIICFYASAFFTYKNISENGALSNIWVTCTAIARYFYKYATYGRSEIIMLLMKLFVPFVLLNILIFVMSNIKTVKQWILIALLYIGIWAYNADLLLTDNVFSWAEYLSNNQIETYEHTNGKKIYLYYDGITLGGVFQFLSLYNPVSYLRSLEDIPAIGLNAVVITDNDDDIREQLEDIMYCYYVNDAYLLWEPK